MIKEGTRVKFKGIDPNKVQPMVIQRRHFESLIGKEGTITGFYPELVNHLPSIDVTFDDGDIYGLFITEVEEIT